MMDRRVQWSASKIIVRKMFEFTMTCQSLNLLVFIQLYACAAQEKRTLVGEKHNGSRFSSITYSWDTTAK